MAKKRDQGWGKSARKPKLRTAKVKQTRPKRVNTIKANGGLPESREIAPEIEKVPIGEAMRQAVEALGDVKIDDDLAPGQLRQLAECYEDVTRRQAAFNAKAEEAKTAKKSLESATELLLEKGTIYLTPSST